MKRIAAIAQVDPALVSRVVNGRQRHRRIEELVTETIGKPGEVVFPPRENAA